MPSGYAACPVQNGASPVRVYDRMPFCDGLDAPLSCSGGPKVAVLPTHRLERRSSENPDTWVISLSRSGANVCAAARSQEDNRGSVA